MVERDCVSPDGTGEGKTNKTFPRVNKQNSRQESMEISNIFIVDCCLLRSFSLYGFNDN